MIKDRMITLADGTSYYIFKEYIYNNKVYVLAAYCDIEKDEIDIENLVIKELIDTNHELIIRGVEDVEVAKQVLKGMLSS